MNRIAAQRDRKAVLEGFRRALSDAGNLPYYPSGSDRFIDGDVMVAADADAKNAPVFIDTVDTVISQLRSLDPGLGFRKTPISTACWPRTGSATGSSGRIWSSSARIATCRSRHLSFPWTSKPES